MNFKCTFYLVQKSAQMVSEQLTELSLNGCPCNSTQINWESWTTACKSMKLEHTLTPCTKINSNGLRANIRQDLVKLLQESRSKTLSNINHTTGFLGQSPKAIEIKTKISKWDLAKLTSFCTYKLTSFSFFKETMKKKNEKTTYRMGENI